MSQRRENLAGGRGMASGKVEEEQEEAGRSAEEAAQVDRGVKETRMRIIGPGTADRQRDITIILKADTLGYAPYAAASGSCGSSSRRSGGILVQGTW